MPVFRCLHYPLDASEVLQCVELGIKNYFSYPEWLFRPREGKIQLPEQAFQVGEYFLCLDI